MNDEDKIKGIKECMLKIHEVYNNKIREDI